jgi:hypothetical protein
VTGVGGWRYDPATIHAPWGETMRRTTTAAVVLLLAVGAGGCSSDKHDPDPAACRKAIEAQYEPGTATLKGDPKRPKECDGMSDDQVSRIALNVIEENTQ